MARYVPPYDRKEKHFPGYNYAGPGTNVGKRLRNNVKPVNKIDAACFRHDLVTEPRGPYYGKNNPKRMRQADKKLIRDVKKVAYVDPPVAFAIIAAMKALLRTGARGRK